MKLGPRKLFALVIAVAMTAGLIVAVTFGGPNAALVMLGVLQVVTLIGIAGAFVTSARQQRRTVASAERVARRAHDELLAGIDDLLAQHRETLRADLDGDLGPAVLAAEAHLSVEVNGLRRVLERTEQRLERSRVRDWAQLEALTALYIDVRPVAALPPTRGWAASPDLLRTCWNLAIAERPELILECGSGVSTLVFAYACQRNGMGRVIALDHDEGFAAVTSGLLRDHGLSDWAEVRVAPLEPVEGTTSVWYRTAEVPAGPIDLVLVDGPPAGGDPQARLPAMDVLHERLSPHATVVVDDYVRGGERETVTLWLERFPELRTEKLAVEKGGVLLRRSASPSG